MSKSESSNDTSSNKRRAFLMIGIIIAIFVLVSQTSGYLDAVLAAGLAYLGWISYQHHRILASILKLQKVHGESFASMLESQKVHGESLAIHGKSLEFFFDDRGRLLIERVEDEYRQPSRPKINA